MDRRISLLVLFIAAAGASPVVAPAISHADTTLVLFEHDTVQHQLDLGATGPSALDQFIFAGDVFDRPGGVFLGTAGGSCTTLSGTQSACNATFSLAGGQIVVQGVADSAALFEAGQAVPLDIVGGSGIYQGARGDGTIQVPPDVPDQKDANFVLNIVE
jgi:hypothetical protein